MATSTLQKHSTALYTYLHNFSKTRAALLLVAIWAFFEASVFFIFPDLILIILILVNPKIKWKVLTVTVAFSLLGIASFYVLSNNYNDLGYSMLKAIPLTNEADTLEAEQILYDNGPMGALQQVFRSPAKIWAYSAAVNHVPILAFLFWIGLARFLRMCFLAFIVALIAQKFPRGVKEQFVLFLSIIILVVLAITVTISLPN